MSEYFVLPLSTRLHLLSGKNSSIPCYLTNIHDPNGVFRWTIIGSQLLLVKPDPKRDDLGTVKYVGLLEDARLTEYNAKSFHVLIPSSFTEKIVFDDEHSCAKAKQQFRKGQENLLKHKNYVIASLLNIHSGVDNQVYGEVVATGLRSIRNGNAISGRCHESEETEKSLIDFD